MAPLTRDSGASVHAMGLRRCWRASRHPASRLRVAAGGAVCALGIAVLPSLAAGEPGAKSHVTREYDLKAAFLFNFAQFVEWPGEAFPDSKTPITIGVLGDDPFGASLDQIIEDETVRGRKIVVRRFQDPREISGCQIVFVGGRRPAQLEALRAASAARSILTVGETDEFSARSGMVRFIVVENKVRLRINLAAARAARLTISSKLLRQAEIVGAGGMP